MRVYIARFFVFQLQFAHKAQIIKFKNQRYASIIHFRKSKYEPFLLCYEICYDLRRSISFKNVMISYSFKLLKRISDVHIIESLSSFLLSENANFDGFFECFQGLEYAITKQLLSLKDAVYTKNLNS